MQSGTACDIIENDGVGGSEQQDVEQMVSADERLELIRDQPLSTAADVAEDTCTASDGAIVRLNFI